MSVFDLFVGSQVVISVEACQCLEISHGLETNITSKFIMWINVFFIMFM